MRLIIEARVEARIVKKHSFDAENYQKHTKSKKCSRFSWVLLPKTKKKWIYILGPNFFEGNKMEPKQTNVGITDQRPQTDVPPEPPAVHKKSMMAKCLDHLLTIKVGDPDEAPKPHETAAQARQR